MTYRFRYRRYAEALYDALQEDAFYLTMEKSVPGDGSKEAMVRYMDYSMAEAERYGELFVPETHDYGVSVWSRPLGQKRQHEKQERKKTFLEDHMGQESVTTYEAIVDFMAERSNALVKGDSWYLSIVGIQPEFQGQGLGAGLVKAMLARTDTLGVATYLETFSSRNMSFYHRLGYRALEGIDEPTTGARYWLMSRAANSAPARLVRH